MTSFICKTHRACNLNTSAEATVYCTQCDSLQCTLCEQLVHGDFNDGQHERLSLTQIDGEYCSIDEQHSAIFYCTTCRVSFCHSCHETQHAKSDGRVHKLQKFRQSPVSTTHKTM